MAFIYLIRAIVLYKIWDVTIEKVYMIRVFRLNTRKKDSYIRLKNIGIVHRCGVQTISFLTPDGVAACQAEMDHLLLQ